MEGHLEHARQGMGGQMGLDGSWAEVEARVEDSRLRREDHRFMIHIAACIESVVEAFLGFCIGEGGTHADSDV